MIPACAHSKMLGEEVCGVLTPEATSWTLRLEVLRRYLAGAVHTLPEGFSHPAFLPPTAASHSRVPQLPAGKLVLFPLQMTSHDLLSSATGLLVLRFLLIPAKLRLERAKSHPPVFCCQYFVLAPYYSELVMI